jgi:hypothetical protein
LFSVAEIEPLTVLLTISGGTVSVAEESVHGLGLIFHFFFILSCHIF